MGSNITLLNTELKKQQKKNVCMPGFEQQETPSYVALVWTIKSTQLKSAGILFRNGII